jgi:hypothetical protein
MAQLLAYQRVTHPLCCDEFWSQSQITAPSAECEMCDIKAKSPSAKKAEFTKIFVLNAEFLEVSCQTLLVAEVPNRYFGAELSEIAQYWGFSFKSTVTRHAPPCQGRILVAVTHHGGVCRMF